MNLIRDLNESRLYRRLGQLEGKTVHDIAERLFEHLLALQILANESSAVAARYADQIMRHQDFSGFRVTQPDLYNLITLVLRQDQYSDKIITDASIGIPELRLKRNLRSLSKGTFDNNDYSQMMLIMQRRFEKMPMQLIGLRRRISDWKRLSNSEKTSAIKQLRLNMRERGIQSDFFVELDRLA